MNPIYKPKGKAAEYCEWALNIYTGCPHRCVYCFSPLTLKRDRETFHSVVEPRNGVVEATKRQLDKEQITGRLIHLCFTCDPYPIGYDTTPTREIIKAIKESRNHVQILTKGGVLAERDFDLLDSNDWFGVTYTGEEFGGKNELEPNASSKDERLLTLFNANQKGINTWMSCEPVTRECGIYSVIVNARYIDLYRIGKLNYAGLDPRLKEIHDSIDWATFGNECVRLCEKYGRNYYIKDGLRAIMDKGVKSE